MRLGIIGVGNIGEIFAERLAGQKHTVLAYDVRAERLAEVVERCGIEKAASNKGLIGCSEVVIVAVKPQAFASLVEELKGVKLNGKLLVSVLAGVPTRKYEDALPGVKVIRIMPNLPIKIGKGVIALAKGKNVTQEEEQKVAELLAPLGAVEKVPEEKMDAVTALSGSGAGYVFAIIEALADAGVRVGLDYSQSLRMVARTLAGSAEMLESSGEHPEVLKNRVASPAGTTIEGLFVMEQRGIRGILIEAVSAAYRRAKELA